MELTDIKSSFPIKVSSINRNSQVDITSSVDAWHNAYSSVLINVLAYHILCVKPADNATFCVKTRACDVNHHSAQHVATLWSKYQWLGRVNSC